MNGSQSEKKSNGSSLPEEKAEKNSSNDFRPMTYEELGVEVEQALIDGRAELDRMEAEDHPFFKRMAAAGIFPHKKK